MANVRMCAAILRVVASIPVSIVSNERSVVPARLPISSRLPPSFSVAFPVSASAAPPASTDEKRSLTPTPVSCARFSISFSASWTLPPSAMNCLNDFPAIFSKTAAVADPSLDSSTNSWRSWVVATDVGMPWPVIVASAAVTWSSPTPSAAAVGTTWKRVLESSSNVVLPSLTPVKRMSEASAAERMSAP
jgi:hypothetical protein